MATDETMIEDASFIPADLAIQAMRDSGYKNTAYALAELIDNSVQAEAKNIEIICIERDGAAQRSSAQAPHQNRGAR